MVMEHHWDHNYNMTKAKLLLSEQSSKSHRKETNAKSDYHSWNEQEIDAYLERRRITCSTHCHRAPSSSSCLYPWLVEERSTEETRSSFSTTREPLRGLAPSWTPTTIEPLFTSSVPLLQIRFCTSNNTKFYIIICIQFKINGWNYALTIVLRGSIIVIHANKRDTNLKNLFYYKLLKNI